VTLSIAQPALSRYVKALETELGVKLFYRNGRGIILTEAGKLLDQYAKSILEQASRAASEIAAWVAETFPATQVDGVTLYDLSGGAQTGTAS